MSMIEDPEKKSWDDSKLRVGSKGFHVQVKR